MDRVRVYTGDCLQLRPKQVLQGVGGAGLKTGGRYGVSWSNGSAVSLRCEEIDAGGGVLRLAWSTGAQNGEPHGHALCFERTPCGRGSRAWWLCPSCSKRCGVVYLRWDRFACRSCQWLHYRSQSLDPLDRAFRTRDKTAARIDPDADPDWSIERPAGMRRSKYWRLVEAHDRARVVLYHERNLVLLEGAARLGIVPR